MQITRVKLSPQGGTKYAFGTSKSSRKRSARKRSSHKKKSTRRRTTGRKRSSRRKCDMEPSLLAFLNTLKWDVAQTVDNAIYMGRKITLQEYNQLLCNGQIRLLLPAATPTAADQLSVLYEVPLSRKAIRIADILVEIWKFYNDTRINKVDVQNLSVSEVATKALSSGSALRFRDFNAGHTQFIGLVPQAKGVYLVQLGPSGSVSSSSLV